MYKITCPNKSYNGVSATVNFNNGVGITEKESLIPWFKKHGYTVEEIKEDGKENLAVVPEDDKEKEDDLGNMPKAETTVDIDKLKKEELIKLCEENGIPVVKEDTKETLKEKLKALNLENDKTEDDVNE